MNYATYYLGKKKKIQVTTELYKTAMAPLNIGLTRLYGLPWWLTR